MQPLRVELCLTGTVVGQGGEGSIFVMVWHPHDSSQLIDLSFPADEVVILATAAR